MKTSTTYIIRHKATVKQCTKDEKDLDMSILFKNLEILMTKNECLSCKLYSGVGRKTSS